MSSQGNPKQQQHQTGRNILTQYNEAPLTATLKSSGDFDSAWLVVRASTPVEMQSMLDALTTNGFGAVLAQADQAFKGSFQAGKGLGATPVEAPRNPEPPAQSYSAPAQQAPPADQNPWGVSAPPAQDNPWGQSVPQGQPQQAAGNFGGGDDAPFLPGIGMQAKIITGVSNKTNKAWRAAADPRDKSITQGKERTDDPNHPGLVAGTHSFWKFMRD